MIVLSIFLWVFMWLLMVGNIAANEHDHETLIEMLIFFQTGFLEMRLLLLSISVLLRLLIDTAKQI